MTEQEGFWPGGARQPFTTVPYTVHLNDIASFSFSGCLPHIPATGKGRQYGRPAPGVHRGTPASFH